MSAWHGEYADHLTIIRICKNVEVLAKFQHCWFCVQFGRTIAFLLLYRILCYYAPMCACSTLLSLSEISFFHLWHICFHMLLSCPIVSHHCSHNIPLAYAYAYAHSYHSVVCAEITESKGGVAGRKLMAWWHWGGSSHAHTHDLSVKWRWNACLYSAPPATVALSFGPGRRQTGG